MITEEDERRYKLRPLPDVPFIGTAASTALNALYELKRKLWRQRHPVRDAKDC